VTMRFEYTLTSMISMRQPPWVPFMSRIIRYLCSSLCYVLSSSTFCHIRMSESCDDVIRSEWLKSMTMDVISDW
jgi:hypothetical protein